jgi:hypothetical protein
MGNPNPPQYRRTDTIHRTVDTKYGKRIHPYSPLFTLYYIVLYCFTLSMLVCDIIIYVVVWASHTLNLDACVHIVICLILIFIGVYIYIILYYIILYLYYIYIYIDIYMYVSISIYMYASMYIIPMYIYMYIHMDIHMDIPDI